MELSKLFVAIKRGKNDARNKPRRPVPAGCRSRHYGKRNGFPGRRYMAQLGTPHAIRKAPAIIKRAILNHSIKVELSTPAIGAEITNISIADVAKDHALATEIRGLWL